MKEAMLYEKLDTGQVRCHLCAHRCLINSRRRGICGVRENQEGVLYSLVYGTLIAENVDPIEKKPFFHVYPASQSFPLQPWDVISVVLFAKTTIFLRCREYLRK